MSTHRRNSALAIVILLLNCVTPCDAGVAPVTLTPVLDAREPITGLNGNAATMNLDGFRYGADTNLTVFANRSVVLQGISLGNPQTPGAYLQARVSDGRMEAWGFRGQLNQQGLRAANTDPYFSAQFGSVDEDGTAVVSTSFVDDHSNPEAKTGYFIGTPGHLQLVVSDLDPLPFIGEGAFMTRFDWPGDFSRGLPSARRIIRVIADGPDVIFDTRIWHCFFDEAGLSPVWPENGWMPGLPAGTRMIGFGDSPHSNRAGQVLANVTLKRDGVSERAAVMIENGTARILMSDTSAPPIDGLPAYRVNVVGRSLSANGHWAINVGRYVPKTSPPEYEPTIWTGIGSSRQLVIGGRQSAPGLLPGSEIVRVDSPSVANDGSVVFEAALVTPTNWRWQDLSLWMWRGGTPRMLIREYTTPPGLPANRWVRAFRVTRTDDGRAMVTAIVYPFGSTTQELSSALWLTDANDTLVPMLLPGDDVRVGTLTKRVKSIKFGGDGAMNGRVMIAVIDFEDGESGIYLINLERAASPSIADINADGFVDGYDTKDFIRAFTGEWTRPGQTADLDNDGVLTFMDFDAFIEAFERDWTN